MKRTLKKVLCLAMAAMMGLSALTGCGNKAATSSGAPAGSNASAPAKSDKKIAIVCDTAGQNDNGYNQAAVNGAKEVAQKYGVQYKVVEPTNGVPAALEALADDGYNVIFSLEYDFDALIKGVGGAKPIAESYPNTTFVVFNDNPNVTSSGAVKYKNVISVLFDVHEASFLAGSLSVLVNENEKTLFADGYKFKDPASGGRAIGFIGGTNSNGITVFSDGYIQGINYMAKELGVKYDFYAKYDAGFTDSALGSTVAGTYYDKGANIVYGVAGGVGEGITSKAKEVGRLAIQVDANKDNQQPGYVLTSVLKNTNVPVVTICAAMVNNKLSTMQNVQSYSLSSGATGITDLSEISKHIASTDAAKAKWKEIQAKITEIRGKIGTEIKVVNAQAGEKFDPSTCPNVTIK
ncbi:BMP family lipoprotein [Caproiciproducens galactitolivorans]|uniref:BMP family ABC transporter substrate-binding protein n=1 Tax=Caproiciproducens galactitolivorans TaxID=642589 RepID=A0ABT4BV67_9FIRM|nr:BMP family ABC transporter substrate-binding protein [Caproiciproducens galactitolivorans]MCY1714774.1 BMP family ABC transporter substrate-binding protein [Caproiciproducens galactitolivorans]